MKLPEVSPYLDSNYANQENSNAIPLLIYTAWSLPVAFIEARHFLIRIRHKQSLEELNNDMRLFQFGGTVSITI